MKELPATEYDTASDVFYRLHGVQEQIYVTLSHSVITAVIYTQFTNSENVNFNQ